MFIKRSETVPPQCQFFTCICFFLVLVSIDTCSGRRCPAISEPSRPVSRDENAPNTRFPYICYIRNSEDRDHECGGTLIEGRWLLTAAHCVDPNDTDSTGTSPFIYCDVHRRNDHRKSKTYSARATYIHGEWESNETEKGFDIALIELDRVADLHVPELDVAGTVYGPGTRFSVVGWGLTENHRPANVPQIGLNLDFVPNDICSKDDLWGGDFKNSMICAGTGATDTRKGDPGGPLLILNVSSGNHKDGDPRVDRLVGITSFGLDEVPEGEDLKPAVYTSVAFFREWIDCVIEGNITNDDCPVKYIPNSLAADPSLISPDLPVPFAEIEESVPAQEEEDEALEALSDEFDEEEDLERMKNAIEKDDSGTVECILAEGMDPNTKYTVNIENTPNDTTSIVHLAAQHNAVESLKVLVDYGADVDIRGDRQQTPLHVAAEHGSLGVAKVLVREGARLNVKSRRGDAPLHFAAYYGSESIVEMLIEEGADVNSKNDNEDTPLHIVAAKGFLSIVELLLDNEASKAVTNESGETPFDLICEDLDRNTECNDETRKMLEDLLSID